ncbi:TPA: type I DNA topoisomerase [Candidatus Falkowbacteria bacterium]|nr:type I DNA topoisomerase [Candidatus Falkowbacteria bacterium]
MKLVIVESPTKAKTISKFLPKDYKVESSFGHVRDLPAKELGVDVEKNFEPSYEIIPKAEKQVKKLKELGARAEEIILASDEDREGEAISWHLRYILKPKKYSRITFHEITKPAIEHALEHPRDINENLVDAQQARRVLDRLVGFKLSPFLWKKVARGLSAGRVQSVAVRLIVEREREREAFNIEEYWTVEATFDKNGNLFEAKLHAHNGKSLKKLAIKNKDEAEKILAVLKSGQYSVASVTKKQTKKNPPTPLTTSSLQQAANNKLGFSAKQTMMLAQQLYEGVRIGSSNTGLITYMRTDSLNLSDIFLKSAHDFLKNTYGDQYVPAKPIKYKSKSKGAQEAHEAIRPTDPTMTPASIKAHLDEKQFKLYNLIWSRTMATQMKPAILDAVVVDINNQDNSYTFRATGQTINFDGYLKVYQEATKENILPALETKDSVASKDIHADQHYTQPPARYTEATLVKAMEEYGIGRPSTYAPTIATIQDRKYVEKEAKALKPTQMGLLVTDILVEHFPRVVDYDFTADLETQFDQIEDGAKKWQPVVEAFYTPFADNLAKKSKELTKKELTEEETDEKCEKCNSAMVIKTGRYGRFMACSNYPECRNTKNIDSEGNEVAKPEPEATGEKCPDCDHPLVERVGRYGKFIGCSNYPECKYIQKKDYGTGVKCPDCGEGEIVSRRSRGGKIFYGCNGYPKCKFTLWQRPTGESCQECKALMIYAAKDKPKCSNAECSTNKKS